MELLVKLGHHVIVPAFVGQEDSLFEDGSVSIPSTCLDMTSFDSVRAFALDVQKHYSKIDVLVCNYEDEGMEGDKREFTDDGVEALMQVNNVTMMKNNR